MWQITMEQGGHDLQSCLACYLRRTGQTRFAATSTELSLPYFRDLGIPGAQSVVSSIFNAVLAAGAAYGVGWLLRVV